MEAFDERRRIGTPAVRRASRTNEGESRTNEGDSAFAADDDEAPATRSAVRLDRWVMVGLAVVAGPARPLEGAAAKDSGLASRRLVPS